MTRTSRARVRSSKFGLHEENKKGETNQEERVGDIECARKKHKRREKIHVKRKRTQEVKTEDRPAGE